MKLGLLRFVKKYLPNTLKVIAILSILLSSLLYFPQESEKVEAATFSFPKLGADTLKDPEGYEKAGLLTTVGIGLTGNTPARTETLDKSYYGFSLSGDFSDVTLKVKKSNGSYTSLLKAEGDDAFYGSDENFDTSNEPVSVLYAFAEGVSEIEFYYSGEKNFFISKYEFAPAPASVIKPAEYASTAAETNYKEKLFSEMGFNLITREEWGAPTASPWAPNIVDVNRIVVHHTATSVDMANPKNTVMAVYNFHYNKCSDNSGSWPNCADPGQGTWTDIGYNYLIDPYGNIYEGRAGGNGVVGAHAIPNTGSIGISILGNYVSQQATQASMEALTRLVSAVTQLNDFDAVWHGGDPASGTGLYGHKDLTPTACPATIYNSLPSISSLAIQMKPANAKLKEINADTRELTSNREYVVDGTSAQLFLDTTNLSSVVKEKLLTASRGVTEVEEVGNTIIYKAKNSLINQLVAETLLVAPEADIQPNYLYRLETWDNTDPQRSIPTDYDVTTHWTHEKIKAPEAWKNLGGCTSDNTCGGAQSVVVAVLDTGLAYENFNFDAGDDDTYTSEKFSGLFMEYPTDSTQDGVFVSANYEGYERDYDQSSEMSGVNIVTPYDAVQDYFCLLRTLDVSSANNCNANETAKIDHPNDDNGHGTFVSTIISGKTSDAAPNKVVGIGHNLSIMPIKVFYPNDSSMCQDSSGNLDLTCSYSPRDYRSVGDSYVISAAIDYAVANGADVINMSLRGVGTDPLMQNKITDAIEAGVTVVVAAGNDNGDVANYFPASFPNVITVGATDDTDERANYSNYGVELDLVAPVGDSGSKIASQTFSCFPSEDNCSDETNAALFTTFTSSSTPTTGTGTSFSAPQVAAAVGLIKSKDATLTPTQIANLLKGTATVLGGGYNINTGEGILNIDEALNLVDAINDGTNPNANPSPDGNNSTDIIAFNRSTTAIDVTPSTGTNFGGGFGGAQVWNSLSGYSQPAWRILKPADVNGDGRLDVIAFNTSTTQVDVTISKGDKFGSGYKSYQIWNSNTFYSTKDWVLLDPADVNNDGMADLIAFKPSTTMVKVTLSDGLSFGGGFGGSQTWNTQTYYGPDWNLLDPTDVNNDGMADLIAFKPSTTAVNVTLSTGTNFGGGSAGSQIWNSKTFYGSDWRLLEPADVNNDGNADLIAFKSATTAVNVTLSNGTNFGGGFGGSQIWNSMTYYATKDWTLLPPKDVNSDGNADLIAFNFVTTAVDVTPSNGTNFGGGVAGYQIWNSKTFYSTANWILIK